MRFCNAVSNRMTTQWSHSKDVAKETQMKEGVIKAKDTCQRRERKWPKVGPSNRVCRFGL